MDRYLPADVMARADWFVRDRLGLMIVWGLHALPAVGEWALRTRGIPSEEYRKLALEFNPVHFDANEWVRVHSAQREVDSHRIAAAGGSAGGYIALSTAVFDTFDEPGEDQAINSKPNALVLFNPAVDTTRAMPVKLKALFDV